MHFQRARHDHKPARTKPLIHIGTDTLIDSLYHFGISTLDLYSCHTWIQHTAEKLHPKSESVSGTNSR